MIGLCVLVLVLLGYCVFYLTLRAKLVGMLREGERRSDHSMTQSWVRGREEAAAALVLGYVTLALYYRAREAAGLLTCDCYQDCWCRKPGLSIFRWVWPRYHQNPGLTEEEKRVLELLARGRTSKEMAAELEILPDAVRTHVQGILAKLQVHSRLEAVARRKRTRSTSR